MRNPTPRKRTTGKGPKPATRRLPGAPAPEPPQPPSARAQRQTERREAILAAALEEFSASGFASTRLDDIARRAGIAKGTIYLYFRDKESLFEDLVRSMLGPLVGAIEAAPLADMPARAIAEAIVDLFIREIYSTRRKDVLRLIISEGPRFPKMAEFYYREVIEHIQNALRALLARAVERGELAHDTLVRFPQLLIAPGLVAVVWSGLFDRFAPLDVRDLMRAHLDILFGKRTAP